jgi:anaerobic selenocysteine-containing dehydrogenase
MGLVHGDGNTRQCMATSVVAHKESFGFDAPPYTYADLEASDVIVLVGSNVCIAHPILWERIARNPHDPEIIVVDPRVTETAMAATQHYAPRPKSDLTLLLGWPTCSSSGAPSTAASWPTTPPATRPSPATSPPSPPSG